MDLLFVCYLIALIYFDELKLLNNRHNSALQHNQNVHEHSIEPLEQLQKKRHIFYIVDLQLKRLNGLLLNLQGYHIYEKHFFC